MRTDPREDAGAAPEPLRRVLATALFLVNVAANVVYVGLARGLDGHPELSGSGQHLVPQLVIGGLATGALGLLLTWLRPRNPVGWWLSVSGAALALCSAGQNYGGWALVVSDAPFGTAVLALSAPLWTLSLLVPVTVILVRYPTGTLSGVWPRRFERGAILGWLLVYAAYAGSPNAVTDEVPAAEALFVLPYGDAVLAVGGVLLFGSAGLIALDAARRARLAHSAERAAILLFLVTGVTSVVLVMASDSYLAMVAFLAVLVALTVGVLRWNALGIEVVVRRTLLFVVTTGLVLVAYVGITTVLAGLLPTGPTPQIVAASLIALTLAPARERVQDAVDRLVYGEREDPATTLRRLGASMGSAPADGLLLAVTANLAESLHLDGARIVAADGTEVAVWGAPRRVTALPLTFAGTGLGRLEVGRRAGEGALGRGDRQLLETVTPLIAAVVHAVALTDDLRAERNRVVDATEAERRRLRQELHDGLGPSLTGVGLGLEAVQSSGSDPQLVTRLRAEVASSLEEIRRIIDDLRPVSLDSRGLLEALRDRAAVATRGGVTTTVEAPEVLPVLPPDVEVAAFRIADEALTNVLRHSGARRCVVRLEVGAGLRLTVADDGHGLAVSPVPEDGTGVGLGSMRERAARVGGSLRLVSAPEGGLGVVADLPLSPARAPTGASREVVS
jgi:two-component system, NarL family, sensor kinase